MKAKMMIASVVVAFFGVVLFSTAAMSKPEFAKATGQQCTACHVQAGKPELNAVGKCVKGKLTGDKKAPEKADYEACKDAK